MGILWISWTVGRRDGCTTGFAIITALDMKAKSVDKAQMKYGSLHIVLVLSKPVEELFSLVIKPSDSEWINCRCIVDIT